MGQPEPRVIFDIVDDRWAAELPAGERLARHAISATLANDRPQLDASRVEIGLTLTDDAAIQVLNRDYRRQDKPTNVLSFPLLTDLTQLPADAPILLGDIALAFETIAAEAKAAAIPLNHHVTHLIVHGTLHLLGHDHQDDSEAQTMEDQETQILIGLGVPDPYKTTA